MVNMGFFFRVSFGTAIALVTGVLLWAAWSAAAAGRWDVVQASATLWVAMAVLVAAGWGLWGLVGWVLRRKR